MVTGILNSTIPYWHQIHLVLAWNISFPLLYGQESGLQIRCWCKKHFLPPSIWVMQQWQHWSSSLYVSGQRHTALKSFNLFVTLSLMETETWVQEATNLLFNIPHLTSDKAPNHNLEVYCIIFNRKSPRLRLWNILQTQKCPTFPNSSKCEIQSCKNVMIFAVGR